MPRHLFFVVVLAVAALAVPASALATDRCVNPGGTGGCSATIQGAVDLATDGDRVLIDAGTYTQPQVLVTKGVELIGAGRDVTIIDGGAVSPPTAGLLRLNALDDDIDVSGLTLRNAGSAGGTTSAVAVKGVGALGRTYTLRDVEVEGRGTADSAIYADNSDVDLEVLDSFLAGSGGNVVLLEKHRGATRFERNTVASAGLFSVIFVMSYGGDRVSAPQRFSDNTITGGGGGGISINGSFDGGEGGFRDVGIFDNTISGTTTGVALNNVSTQASGDDGMIYEPAVEGNRLNGNGNANGRGIGIAGEVVRADIFDNSISGYPVGVRFASAGAGHAQSDALVQANRLVGNTVGLENVDTPPVDAQENWWGCNAGPGTVGCDTLTGAGVIDRDPWLVASASADPAAIETGGDEALVTVDLLTNSDGGDASLGPSNVPVSLTTTLGTIDSPVETLYGAATSTLTSGATPGTATVSATVDTETVTDEVTFTAPPAPPGPPAATTTTVTVPGPVVASAPSASPPAPPGLRVLAPDLTGVWRSGRFFVHAIVRGPGTLSARGTATGGRLAGRRYSVAASDVIRLRMRLPRAARRALNRGRRVTSRVTVTFTPRGATTPITRTVTLRMGPRGA